LRAALDRYLAKNRVLGDTISQSNAERALAAEVAALHDTVKARNGVVAAQAKMIDLLLKERDASSRGEHDAAWRTPGSILKCSDLLAAARRPNGKVILFISLSLALMRCYCALNKCYEKLNNAF